MDTGRTDILSRHPVPRHRLTVDEYHRLGEAGILGEDDRVELLEGQLAAYVSHRCLKQSKCGTVSHTARRPRPGVVSFECPIQQCLFQ